MKTFVTVSASVNRSIPLWCTYFSRYMDNTSMTAISNTNKGHFSKQTNRSVAIGQAVTKLETFPSVRTAVTSFVISLVIEQNRTTNDNVARRRCRFVALENKCHRAHLRINCRQPLDAGSCYYGIRLFASRLLSQWILLYSARMTLQNCNFLHFTSAS